MKLKTAFFLFKALAVAALCLSVPAQAGAQGVATPSIEVVVSSPAPLEAMPSWLSDGRPVPDADVALDVLANAQSQGLNPVDYQAQELVRAFALARRDGLPPEMAGRLDAELTAALEHYLTDLRHGRLSPDVLKQRFKVPDAAPFDARQHIAQARQAGLLAGGLMAAQPQVPMYEALKTAMNAYREMGDHEAWQQPLPPMTERSLKPGQSWGGLSLVAARLVALGDLDASAVFTGDTYEDWLAQAVERFQGRHGLETDGVLGPATLAALDVAPAQRVKQMAITLERLRWTPLLHGPRMVVVNVPEFILRAYERQGSEIELNLEMRVVVGRALDTRTPIFMEDMRFIEFSPYWNVPLSIARRETLPRLKRDPAYFDQQGFEFVSRDGTVINTLTEEGMAAVQRGEWRIRQRPGPRNAMGDIKFILPNDQNIYLHYTPAPQLFARARRDFSHGCIRIEEPVALARFILQNQPEWTVERIESAMQGGRSRTLRLREPVPVLITYSTVVVKNDKVYFFPDIYQQDALLEQALQRARPYRS